MKSISISDTHPLSDVFSLAPAVTGFIDILFQTFQSSEALQCRLVGSAVRESMLDLQDAFLRTLEDLGLDNPWEKHTDRYFEASFNKTFSNLLRNLKLKHFSQVRPQGIPKDYDMTVNITVDELLEVLDAFELKSVIHSVKRSLIIPGRVVVHLKSGEELDFLCSDAEEQQPRVFNELHLLFKRPDDAAENDGRASRDSGVEADPVTVEVLGEMRTLHEYLMGMVSLAPHYACMLPKRELKSASFSTQSLVPVADVESAVQRISQNKTLVFQLLKAILKDWRLTVDGKSVWYKVKDFLVEHDLLRIPVMLPLNQIRGYLDRLFFLTDSQDHIQRVFFMLSNFNILEPLFGVTIKECQAAISKGIKAINEFSVPQDPYAAPVPMTFYKIKGVPLIVRDIVSRMVMTELERQLATLKTYFDNYISAIKVGVWNAKPIKKIPTWQIQHDITHNPAAFLTHVITFIGEVAPETDLFITSVDVAAIDQVKLIPLTIQNFLHALFVRKLDLLIAKHLVDQRFFWGRAVKNGGADVESGITEAERFRLKNALRKMLTKQLSDLPTNYAVEFHHDCIQEYVPVSTENPESGASFPAFYPCDTPTTTGYNPGVFASIHPGLYEPRHLYQTQYPGPTSPP